MRRGYQPQRDLLSARRLGLIVMITSGLFGLSTLNALEARSEIKRVTVFVDRAEVTRAQSMTCGGAQRGAIARFNGLPRQVQLRTLRATASGAEVIGVTHRVDQGRDRIASEPQRDALSASQAALDAQQAELQRARYQLTLLDRQEDTLKLTVAADLRRGLLNIKPLNESLDHLKRERERIHGEMKRLEEARLAQELKLKKLKSELNQARTMANSRAQQSGGDALVSLRCKRAGEVKITLSYVTAGASWSPEYHAQVNLNKRGETLGSGSVEWGVNAVIKQATGEDWRDVKLTLSTTQPNLGDRAPLPAPLHISGRKEERAKVLSQRAEDRSRLQGGGGEGAQGVSVEIDDKGQSFALRVPRSITIKSHGQPYWVPVSEAKARARVQLIATPQISSRVFRVARFKSPTPHPLPRGEVSVSLNGAYLGRAAQRYAGPGEPIELTLGVEDRLRLSRELVTRANEEGGLLDDDRTLKRHFKLTLTSSARAPLKVEVTERLPVSEIKDIKVKLNSRETRPAHTHDVRTGFIKWSVKVKPRATSELHLSYQVKIPEDWRLQ